ncbi:MAG: TauD/TfdA family dioxygenase [Actinomycetota bacterium]
MSSTIASQLHTDHTACRLEIDGRPIELSWRWLRDHARDDGSFLASAHQRLVTPATVASAGEGLAEMRDGGATLRVTWPDGTIADWSVDWLARTSTDADAATSVADLVGAARPWCGAEVAERLTRLPIDEFEQPDGLEAALRGLARDGLVVVTGVPTDQATTRRVIEHFGYVRMTIFGDLWEFRSDGGFDDTASTPLEITPHTDGTYSHDAPGLLALHCHVYEATGGENVFVCGHELSSRLAAASPRHHELLSTIDVPGQYIGDGAHLMARRPPLRHDGERLVQISYNHHDRAPFRLEEPLMTEVFDALAHLDRLANDPALQFELAMRPGDMVVFDNWRVLHGRRAFRGERLIAGGYVNREDVDSTARRLLA